MARFHSVTFPPDYQNRAAQRRLFKRTHAAGSRPAHITKSENRRRDHMQKLARRIQRP